MNTIAVIPARGGSKGIPGKNIKNVAGRPLIAYSIEAALQSLAVDRVNVSTDDEVIANISKANRAEVNLRPSDISGDLASSDSALLHVLQVLAEKEQYQPDIDGTVQALLQFQSQAERKQCYTSFISSRKSTTGIIFAGPFDL